VPRSLGGAGGGARDFVEMVRTLATGDLSAAWTLAFFTAHAWLMARYPAEAQQDLFREGSCPRVAFVGRPPGKAERVDGGYLITGAWGYASGVMNADWVQVPAVIDGTDWTPADGFTGQNLFLVPRAEVEVLDTWYMSGMAATGSNDIRTERAFVPAHRTIPFALLTARDNPGAAIHPEPTYRYSLSDVMMYLFPALAVGCAEAVLADYRIRLESHRAAFSPTLSSDTQAGQIRYAQAFSALRVAQTMLRHAIEESVQAAAESPEEKSDDMRAALKLDCLTVCRMARESVETAVQGSGTAIFRQSDATQRRVRDLLTLLSHVSLDIDGMQHRAGEILLGRATQPNPGQFFV
jgi:alkylation response protein AidB-like acyl-CoA dehydrogenase